MATINYEKEWTRIATRLEWTLTRIEKMLAEAKFEDERTPLRVQMATVMTQLEHARSVAQDYATKRRNAV